MDVSLYSNDIDDDVVDVVGNVVDDTGDIARKEDTSKYSVRDDLLLLVVVIAV